jgi:hypothetical protein
VEPAAVSRTKLVQWAFNIHNKVNKQVGNPEITWEQFLEAILTLRNPKPHNFLWMYALIAGVGIGIGAYAFYKTLK